MKLRSSPYYILVFVRKFALMLLALPVVAVFLAVKKDFGKEQEAAPELSKTRTIALSLLGVKAVYILLIGAVLGMLIAYQEVKRHDRD